MTDKADPKSVTWQDGLRYGLVGLPLAFVALPLYVILPDHYSRELGLPLTTIAGILLGTRLLDALIDPWIGRWVDTCFDDSALRAWRWGIVASASLAASFTALFFPPAGITGDSAKLALWCLGSLGATYMAYSLLILIHQAWGARLGGNEAQQVKWVSWREGLALVGVLLASMLPVWGGLSAMVLCFALALGVGWISLASAPRPNPISIKKTPQKQFSSGEAILRPWKNNGFQKLLPVFLLNGIAMAIPANLVVFFIHDRLQSPEALPAALAIYFAAAALATPAWAVGVKRLGLLRCWAAGMILSVLTFGGATWLGPGDVSLFLWVCLSSGMALGADLALPGALLSRVIQQGGDEHKEGAYFGWWNFANKLNLALAAGICLPILSWLGYRPGERHEAALQALSIAYCLIPCGFKLAALWALYRGWRQLQPH